QDAQAVDQLVRQRLVGRIARAGRRAVEGRREMDPGVAALAGALIRGQVVALVMVRLAVVVPAQVGGPTLWCRVAVVGGQRDGVAQAELLAIGHGERRDVDVLGGALLDLPQQANAGPSLPERLVEEVDHVFLVPGGGVLRLAGEPAGAEPAAPVDLAVRMDVGVGIRFLRHRPGSFAWRSSPGLLELLVGLAVPAGLDGGVQGAVGLLRLVRVLDPGEVQRELFRRDVPGAVAADLVRVDQQVGEAVLEVLLLLAAGLTAGQPRLREVLAAGAGQHQRRAGLADLRREAEVLHGHLAGATAAAVGEGARLARAPTPRRDVDGALVLGVVRLALDP